MRKAVVFNVLQPTKFVQPILPRMALVHQTQDVSDVCIRQPHDLLVLLSLCCNEVILCAPIVLLSKDVRTCAVFHYYLLAPFSCVQLKLCL